MYFEIPSAIGNIQSMRAEVHIYLFHRLPSSPFEALAMLHTVMQSLWCKPEGLELGQGGVELKADWHIESRPTPRLLKADRPFRPRTGPDMQQVRVSVRGGVVHHFEYLFDGGKQKWQPMLDEHKAISVSETHRGLPTDLNLIPREDQAWSPVIGLLESDASTGSHAYQEALEQMKPSAGSFILMAQRRRQRSNEAAGA